MNEINDGWFRKKYKDIRAKYEKNVAEKNTH